ncbi:MAG: hypothetical protein NVS9B15_26200 [Acidobacteriaceae bacterium]
MPDEVRESFCFAVLQVERCSVTEDGAPLLAYRCHVADSGNEAADETIEVEIAITDSESARRAKAANAFSDHFKDRFNISLSTVIFG